jgi:Domain of unknown function (DUF222)
MDEHDDASELPSSAEPGPAPGDPRGGPSGGHGAPGCGPGGPGDGRASDGRGGLPAGLPEDDFDADAEMARWVADIEAGRERIPEEWELDGSAVSLSLGDAADVDPALLAAMLGPDGLGGHSLSAAFGQDQAADALPPGPILSALTEQAACGLARLSDDELTGAIQAARRLRNRDAYLETLMVAEFGRRRAAAHDDAKARKVPAGRRPGEFAPDELAIELVCTAGEADGLIERGLALTARLPRTLAGMAAGTISPDRAGAIAAWTASLTDHDAARADEILAAAAPGLRYDQLSRKAAALELKLNPDGVKARKEHMRQTRQRVEVRREDSGNASIAGRELDTLDALASKAYIDALAVRIRNHGHADGGLEMIRARVMTELLQGRNPLDLLKPRPRHTTRPDGPDARPSAGPADADPPSGTAPPHASADGNDVGGADGNDGADRSAGDRADHATLNDDGHAHGNDGPHGEDGPRTGEAADRSGPDYRDPDDPGPQCPDDPEDLDDCDDDDPGDPAPGYAGPGGAPAWDSNEAEHARYGEPPDPAERRGPLRPDQTAPPPANLNLTIPIGTLLGWSTTPAQAGTLGLLDAEETRDFVAAASRHPRTRWSITLIDENGHAIAHGRARGQHPWEPPPDQTPPPATTPPGMPPAGMPPSATTPPGVPSAGTSPPGGTPPRPRDAPTPNADQLAHLRDLIRVLNIAFDPIAKDTCDHRQAEDHYTPSRKLKDVVRARTITCDAPGCNAQALYCDLDHTVAYPDGPSCQCNLGPKCRRHHRAKQAPGWRVEQPEPGVVRWTLPNGRTHTTTPTEYEL